MTWPEVKNIILSRKYVIEINENWYHHKLEKVIENDQVILWDFDIQTKCDLEAIKAHVSVVKETTEYFLIDMALAGG